jgi:hypothetical protein
MVYVLFKENEHRLFKLVEITLRNGVKIKKMRYLYVMEFTQQQRIIKFSHSQVSGWN